MKDLSDVPLFLVQGEKLDLIVLYEEEDGTPVDITGWTAVFQAKRNFNSETFAIDISSVPSVQGGIEITGSEGKVHIITKSIQTRTLSAGTYRYNCFLYDLEGEPDDILHGPLTVQDSVIY